VVDGGSVRCWGRLAVVLKGATEVGGRGFERNRCSVEARSVAGEQAKLRSVSEGASSEHGPLPIGGPAVGCAGGWFVGSPRVARKHVARVGDHGEELHACLALGAFESVAGEGAPEQLGPGAVGGARCKFDGRLVCGIG
jgi:hypothetical protein